MFPELKFSETQILDYCDSVTPEAVASSLAKDRCDYFDLLNLISSSAAGCIGAMRNDRRWPAAAITAKPFRSMRPCTSPTPV